MKKFFLILLALYVGCKVINRPVIKANLPCDCCEKCVCASCATGHCTPCNCGCDKCIQKIVPQSEAIAANKDHIGSGVYDNREIDCDLPESQHLKNTGGSDGLGLCVFTSIDHAARWQNEPNLIGFRDFMTKYPGGGYPSKVDQYIPKKSGGKPVEYVQFTNGSVAALELALRTGRMPCVTYGYSPRYGQRIAHMVNLVYLDSKWACILDNNFPGVNNYEWTPREEFIRRWKLGSDPWAVVLLNPSPPPVPHN